MIVSVTEISSKMASVLCQKWLTIFVKKLKILYSSPHTILFKFHHHAVEAPEFIYLFIFVGGGGVEGEMRF